MIFSLECQRGELQAQRQAGVFASVLLFDGREASPGPGCCSDPSFHCTCTMQCQKNCHHLPRLHCSSVSPPYSTYCQQLSWIGEDALEFEARSSITFVTSDIWDLALQPVLLMSVPGPWLCFPACSAALQWKTVGCMAEPDQARRGRRARPNLYSGLLDLDGLKQIMMPHHLQ